MPSPRKICPHRRLAGGGAVAMALLGGCSGISDGPGGSTGWPPIALALALAFALALALTSTAGLAYALGALRARLQSRSALRAAREALRQAEQLAHGVAWQTDAQHHLLAWREPGQPPTTDCALFDPASADTTLLDRLRAGQSFSGLRLRGSRSHGHGQVRSVGWALSGVPRSDDEGRFAGFVGSARPTDEDDAMHLAARALAPLLAANPRPCLIAQLTHEGWQVHTLNPAAQALWPQVAVGSALGDALAQLPAAVALAVQSQEAADVQGWRISPLALTTPSVPSLHTAQALLLAGLNEETPGAQAHARDGANDSDTTTFTLSHDLRAPIRVVEGFTRIVKEDYGRLLDRVGNDHLDRVLGAAARMNLMIDALLTLARLSQQPLARQRVNLSQLAGYVVDDLRRSAPERAADIDIEPGLTAWGDPTLLRLVLENLLGNAWKYSGRSALAQISLHTVPHGDATAMVVRDNGAGFDMRSADRLFGLFQRLHSANDFPGHGVGLASVRRIVQRHGGAIWAEGEPGRGASFYFTLPR